MWKKLIEELLTSPLDLHRLEVRKERNRVAVLATRTRPFQWIIGCVFLAPFFYALRSAVLDPFWGTWLALLAGGPFMLAFGTAILTHRSVIIIDATRGIVSRVDRILWWSKELRVSFPQSSKIIVKYRYDHDIDVLFEVILPGAEFLQLVAIFNLRLAREVGFFLAETTGFPLEDQTLAAEESLVKSYGSRIKR